MVTNKANATIDLPAGRPRGPAAVSQSLFAATERLCNEQPPGSVTVRQIAAAADVNHGLVHHYFDSKNALLAATMLRIEEQFLEIIAPIEDPADTIRAFFDELNARPTYPRLLSWMILEGIDPTQQINNFPLIEHLVDVINTTTNRPQARLRTQALLTFLAGWTTIGDFVADATALTNHERTQSNTWARQHAVATALGTMPS